MCLIKANTAMAANCNFKCQLIPGGCGLPSQGEECGPCTDSSDTSCSDWFGVRKVYSGAAIYSFASGGTEKIGYAYPVCWTIYPCNTEVITYSQCGGLTCYGAPGTESCNECSTGFGVSYDYGSCDTQPCDS